MENNKDNKLQKEESLPAYTLEDYCKARAILSCLALYFPEEYRYKVLCMTSKTMSYNPELRNTLIDNFMTTTTLDCIRSIEGIYTIGQVEIEGKFHCFIEDEGKPLEGLELFLIFSLLFSNEFDFVYRAKLISTLRDIRNKLKEDEDYRDAIVILDEYIDYSYSLYCEVTSHVGKMVDFKSHNTLGSFFVVNKINRSFNEDAERANENAIMDYMKESNRDYSCEKTCVIDFWDSIKLDSRSKKERFLSIVYEKLKELSKKR